VWAFVTLSSEGRIQWADFGSAREVTPPAFVKADEWNSFSVEPVRKMIVSPGGLPNDIDLYIAQRALELTAEVVCDGGEILFLSACPKGVGNARTKAEFYDKLICPLEEISAARCEDYRLYSHKPWRFARLIRRLNRLWLHSEIDNDGIKQMHMTPCESPQAVIDEWLRQNPHEKILVVDGGNKLLLRSAL
jgi:nickel-dependent lactate racemase